MRRHKIHILGDHMIEKGFQELQDNQSYTFSQKWIYAISQGNIWSVCGQVMVKVKRRRHYVDDWTIKIQEIDQNVSMCNVITCSRKGCSFLCDGGVYNNMVRIPSYDVEQDQRGKRTLYAII